MAFKIGCQCAACAALVEDEMDFFLERGSSIYAAFVKPHVRLTEQQIDDIICAIADEMGRAAGLLPEDDHDMLPTAADNMVADIEKEFRRLNPTVIPFPPRRKK